MSRDLSINQTLFPGFSLVALMAFKIDRPLNECSCMDTS